MRIGIDARSLEGERTGVGRYLSELLKRFETLAPTGTEFFLYFRSEIPNDFKSRARFTCRVIPPFLGRRSNALFMHRGIPQAFKRDHITAGFFPDYVAPFSLSVPFALTLHDIVYAAQPKLYFWPSLLDRLLLAAASRHAAHRAKTIFVPSLFTQQEVLRIFRVPLDRIRITPEAAGPEFTPQPNSHDREIVVRYGISSRFIFFVGSIFTRRHLPECIRAFTATAQNVPGLQFFIAGRNRTKPAVDIDGLAAKINQDLGYHAIIHVPFIPPQDLPSIYRQAAALLWVSEYEGFGLPVLEALASGCPAITSNQASLPETAGTAGLFVENPADSAAIASHLQRLLTNEELTQELTRKGPEWAASFSWDSCAQKTLESLLAL